MFRIFFFFQQKHIPCCLFVALFFFSFHASPRFFAVALRKSFLFAQIHRHFFSVLPRHCPASMQRFAIETEKKNHRLVVYMSFIRTLRLKLFGCVFFFLLSSWRCCCRGAGECREASETATQRRTLKISPTSDRFFSVSRSSSSSKSASTHYQTIYNFFFRLRRRPLSSLKQR